MRVGALVGPTGAFDGTVVFTGLTDGPTVGRIEGLDTGLPDGKENGDMGTPAKTESETRRIFPRSLCVNQDEFRSSAA